LPREGKQQGDSDVGETIHDHGRRAAAWQEARQDERPYQREDEVVRQELGSGHASDLVHWGDSQDMPNTQLV
jgi:hypothetical protein